MEHTYDLSRFTAAHQRDYTCALQEIRGGRKYSHWMWYIFPQLQGLGRSSTSEYYGIRGKEEAAAFLADPYLGGNLREICQVLLQLPECNPANIFGYTDAMKLRSSMTLFQCASREEPLFTQVLEKYFQGKPDCRTIRMLENPGGEP